MRFQITQPYPVESSLVRVGQIMLPATFTAHLTEDQDGGPDIDIVFEVRSGAVECVEVHIKATDDGHEVRVTGLAGVRIKDVLEETVRHLMYAEPRTDSPGKDYVFPLSAWTGLEDPVKHVRGARTARKVRMTDTFLQEVAEVYRTNIKDHPTEAVAEHFDKAHRTAGLYVAAARSRGFLGAATRGKAGEQ